MPRSLTDIDRLLARRRDASFLRLKDAVRDVCEVDRTRRGYCLVFDDGSSLRVRTREEVRAAACMKRREGK